jgi:hypothetical protein
MNPQQQLYERWAPEGSTWSTWVKPVLFAKMPDIAAPLDGSHAPPAPFDVSWAPPVSDRAAIVLDLPGGASVDAGLALAERGYRPVPLYNVVPGPAETRPIAAAVDVAPVTGALWRGGDAIAQINLPYDAPPAFLLDARRMPPSAPRPGQFDNRWVVLPQDFPSATFLQTHGIRRVLLVQDVSGQPRSDLAHVLRRWQEAGIVIDSLVPGAGVRPVTLDVARPKMFRWMLYALAATMGLRRSSAGGFGSVVPMPSSSHG